MNIDPGNLRVGLIVFRDLPPEPWITRNFRFTPNFAVVESALNSIVAFAGGDGPEAQCNALTIAVNEYDWSDSAEKVCILITDSPPHGTV